MQGFPDSLHHILAELECLDLLIQASVPCARATQGTDDDFQGLYIPEQESDTLLSWPTALPHWWAAAVGPPALPARVCAVLGQITASIALRKADSVCAGAMLCLDERLACSS